MIFIQPQFKSNPRSLSKLCSETIFKTLLKPMTENQYHKEYREYLEFALQKYLQEKEGLSEYDARTQVMQDFENVEKRARLAGYF